MKQAAFICFTLFCLTSHAQKHMSKSFSTEDIKAITLKLDQVYRVTLSTHKKQEVQIETQVEGEHSENIMIISKRMFGSLLISCDMQPAFKDPNDKLSAHKLMAVELTIKVPENFSVYLKSDIANIIGSGHYKKLTLELSSGNCKISDFSGNALINTVNGHIDLQTNNAMVEAATKNGNLTMDQLIPGEHRIELKSIGGDIIVSKSQ